MVECDLNEKTPIATPIWLREALVFNSLSADKLLEFDILYRFADDEGGWSVGNIGAINTDTSVTVMVESEDGLSGELPANVEVHYESDDEKIWQRLSLDNYATDSESEVGSWALLVGAASRPKKRPRAPLRALEVNQAPARGVPAAETMLQLMPPTMDVTALQPEQRRALMAQLAAMDVMEE